MTTLENLARLVAASEDLADSGMVNLQQLLEALVYSAVRVEARAHRRGGEPAERIKEIASVVDGFPDNGNHRCLEEGRAPMSRFVIEHHHSRYREPLNDLFPAL